MLPWDVEGTQGVRHKTALTPRFVTIVCEDNLIIGTVKVFPIVRRTFGSFTIFPTPHLDKSQGRV